MAGVGDGATGQHLVMDTAAIVISALAIGTAMMIAWRLERKAR